MSHITLPRAVAEMVRDSLDYARRFNGASVSAEIAALDAALAEPDAIAAKYNELLMAVGQKYPGETRHETALRYITQAEQRPPCVFPSCLDGIAGRCHAMFKGECAGPKQERTTI